jgi:hypothetical protein
MSPLRSALVALCILVPAAAPAIAADHVSMVLDDRGCEQIDTFAQYHALLSREQYHEANSLLSTCLRVSAGTRLSRPIETRKVPFGRFIRVSTPSGERVWIAAGSTDWRG